MFSRIGSSVAVNVIGYVLLLVALVFVVRAELTDIHCPNPNCKKDECADYGKGMAYDGSAPDAKDTPTVLIDKIQVAAKCDERTVKWRRCFIMSFIFAVALWLLVFGTIPSVFVFVLVIFISMAIWHFSFGYYAFHHYQAAIDNINKSADLLKQKIGDCGLGDDGKLSI